MPGEKRNELLDELESRIQTKKRELAELEIAKRVLLGLGEEQEEDEVASKAVSQGEKSERFRGMSQERAVEILLREAAPDEMHIKRIARLLLRNGYGDGHKTAKQIIGSVSAVLSTGAANGKPFKKGSSRGYWVIAQQENGDSNE